jgi:hypothetical protein
MRRAWHNEDGKTLLVPVVVTASVSLYPFVSKQVKLPLWLGQGAALEIAASVRFLPFVLLRKRDKTSLAIQRCRLVYQAFLHQISYAWLGSIHHQKFRGANLTQGRCFVLANALSRNVRALNFSDACSTEICAKTSSFRYRSLLFPICPLRNRGIDSLLYRAREGARGY